MNALSFSIKFRLTALQVAAIIILPFFVLALYVKLKERTENKQEETITFQKSFHKSGKHPK